MKNLPTYINEKLIIKQKQIITPNSRQELVATILDRFNNGDGNLNNIDVSKLNEEDFYHLFHDLADEIKKNKITEIDISNWDLKELYCFNDTGMFQSCETLETIILPECLETIDYFTFYNCRKLDNIIIPETVTYIGYGTFNNCRRMTSMIIPNSVTSIGYNAFYNCPNLIITVPNKRVKKLVEDSRFNGKIII